MYSMVLMAALTAGGESPQLCFKGCGGGYGCAGYYGCGGYGCYGYGCFSSAGYYRCHGCYGCYGCSNCSGYGGNGCWGCWGSYGYSWYSCDGCSGCWGGSGGCGGGCYGWGGHGCWGSTPYAPMSPAPTMPPAAPGGEMKKENEAGVEDDRARLLIEVPTDARLFIDDQPMKSTSARRNFSTPKLEKGQSYYYELKVEVAREGVTHSETRKVIVRPGEVVRAAFTEGGIVAASRGSNAAKAK